MANDLNDDEKRGYKLAVLQIAEGMCLADTMGDARDAVCEAAKQVDVEIPEDGRGGFDYTATAELAKAQREGMNPP